MLDTSGELVVADGERTPLPYNLSPGESVTLNAIVKAPKQPGKYKLILTMVQENVAWFNDQGANSSEIDIKVIPQ